uniref:Uncharacterized protein n=1 Tax=Terrapene triunguis TaxID=2587831 RepID=A0A674JLM5_9SAUR
MNYFTAQQRKERDKHNLFKLTKDCSFQSGLHCPISDVHINRKEVERISRECRNESFWYRGR